MHKTSGKPINYSPITKNPLISFDTPTLADFMNGRVGTKRPKSTKANASKKRKTISGSTTVAAADIMDVPTFVSLLVQAVQV